MIDPSQVAAVAEVQAACIKLYDLLQQEQGGKSFAEQLAERDAQIASMKVDIAQANLAIEALAAERDALKTVIDDAAATIASQQVEVNQLNSVVTTLTARIAAAQTAARQVTEALNG